MSNEDDLINSIVTSSVLLPVSQLVLLNPYHDTMSGKDNNPKFISVYTPALWSINQCKSLKTLDLFLDSGLPAHVELCPVT